MRATILSLITLICSNACTTSSPVAFVPSADLDHQLTQYIKAKTENSCDGFAELARDENFPLKDLAKLRADEACLKAPVDVNSYAGWLRSTALDAALHSAQKRQDFIQIATLAIEKSKQPLTTEERLEWIKMAKQIAESIKNQELIEQSNARLYLISPRLRPEPAEKDFLSVADDFRYHRNFAKADDYYKKVLNSPAAPLAEKISAYKGMRLSFKNARNTEQSIAANENLINFIEEQLKRHKGDRSLIKELAEVMTQQARSYWTNGQNKEATKMILRAEKRLRQRYPMTNVYWVHARMAEESGDNATCVRYLEKALTQVGNDTETRDKINWVRGWIAKREKDYATAEKSFEQLANETQNEATKHRAEFWLGKVKFDLHKTDDAKAIWEKLTQDDPIGYYGVLAYYQLDKPMQVKSKVTEVVSSTGLKEIYRVLHPEIAESLIRVGELDALQSYLDDVTKVYKKAKNQNDETWVKLLQYYAHAGLYLKLYENLNVISAEQRDSILQNHPELLFPRPFDQEITKAATQFGVEPELIYSIIRQESAFNPKARSGADAFGLMQILPEIAHDLSKKYKMPFDKNEQLYDPAANVKFGAALLHDQMQKYNDQFILAVASYNANDKAIHNWMASRFKGDSLEFIEDIPYEETRGYVRLVMRNLIFYRLLASKNSMLTFPPAILKLSASN